MTISVGADRIQLEPLLLGMLAGIAIVCLVLSLMKAGSSRRPFRAFKFHKPQKPALSLVKAWDQPGLGDSASQLRHVMAADFYKKKIMNKAEYRVFRIVEAEIQSRRNGCRVLSQTSLGEIIGSDDKKAFGSINSKRVDILIMGPYGEAVAAIEFHGGGHFQGTAAARDAVKKEALRKAGIAFVELDESHSDTEISALIGRLFQPVDGPPAAAPSRSPAE